MTWFSLVLGALGFALGVLNTYWRWRDRPPAFALEIKAGEGEAFRLVNVGRKPLTITMVDAPGTLTTLPDMFDLGRGEPREFTVTTANDYPWPTTLDVHFRTPRGKDLAFRLELPPRPQEQ